MSGGGSSAGGAGGAGGAGVAGEPLTGLIGWASEAACGPIGTTGGEGGPILQPTTVEELDDALRSPGAAVIELSGSYKLGDVVLQVSSDKTVRGVESAEIVGAVRVRDASNVVVQNVVFNGGNITGLDALEIDNSNCVWIDHCEFLDGGDDNLDIVRGSDRTTVSWSYFHYVAKTDDHRLGSVCGNSDLDTPGKINVTFHHNWWGAGVLQNMPSVRHGKVHIFNSYFDASDNVNCISAGFMAKLVVENNVFDGVSEPLVFGEDQGTASVEERGNDYSRAFGTPISRGVAFVPPYEYVLDPTATVPDLVVKGAGATLTTR